MIIKKRVVISAIITILVVIATNKYWLLFSPMPVDFDVKGHETVDIEVQLNKKDNDKFNKTKSQTVNIDLNKNNHASFNIQRAKTPKRIRINIFYAPKNEPLELGNVNFRHGKLTLDNLDKFTVEGANYSVENQHLILKPTDNKIVLTYPETLKIRTATKFDFKVFAIILILTFLLSYKLSDYVADFKTVEGKSRVDIIFLTIFFAFLFVPMSHIDQNDISNQENRFLAKWQPLIKENNEINFDFGKNFNDWFNDRFCLRRELVNIKNNITFHVTDMNDKGLIDKTTGISYPQWDFMEYNANELNQNFKSVYKLDDWCKKHRIKLYTLIVPNKPQIYIPKKTNMINRNLHAVFLEFHEKLQQEKRLSVVYPYKELYEGKKNSFTYFKTEHHWTDDGAFIGYKTLMKEINKDYPDIKPLTSDDFEYSFNKLVRGDFEQDYRFGTTIELLGLQNPKKYHDVDYRYYTYKDAANIREEVINIPHHREKFYHYDNGANYRVILLGTSQSENLSTFIAPTFKDVYRLRNNNVSDFNEAERFKIMKRYEQDILDYKPDIIIFCITYGNINELHQLFEME